MRTVHTVHTWNHDILVSLSPSLSIYAHSPLCIHRLVVSHSPILQINVDRAASAPRLLIPSWCLGDFDTSKLRGWRPAKRWGNNTWKDGEGEKDRANPVNSLDPESSHCEFPRMVAFDSWAFKSSYTRHSYLLCIRTLPKLPWIRRYLACQSFLFKQD